MRAAGFELDLALRVRAKTLEHAIARARAAGPSITAILVRSRGWRPIGASMPPPPVSDALADRLIGAAHAAALERGRERLLTRKRARDEQQAARVLVEPVHEPRARQRRERRVEVQQRIL